MMHNDQQCVIIRCTDYVFFVATKMGFSFCYYQGVPKYPSIMGYKYIKCV